MKQDGEEKAEHPVLLKEQRSMKKFLKDNLFCIVVLAGVLILSICLFLFVPVKKTSSGNIVEKQASEIVSQDGALEGTFMPAEEYLQSVSFIVNCTKPVASDALVTLEILEGGETKKTVSRPLAELDSGYMNEFELGMQIEEEMEYSYRITVSNTTADNAVSFDLGTVSCGPEESVDCTVNGKTVENGILLMEYTYMNKMDRESSRVYLVCLFLFAAICLLAFTRREKRTVAVKISMYLLTVCSMILLISLQDEGKKPLFMTGTEMIHTDGAEDYRGYLTINEESGFTGVLAKSKEYMLKRGTYTLQTSYTTNNEANTIEVYQDGYKVDAFNLPVTKTFISNEFTLDSDSQNLEIRVYYTGSGMLKVNQVTLIPKTTFYTDAGFFIFLFILLNLAGICLYARNKRKPFKRETLVNACILASLSLLATIPFFSTSMAGGDDLCYHMLRIEGIKDGIRDGQFPVVIMPNALSGNGYLNSMYPYLFLYLPAIMRLFGVSLTLSYKFLIFIVNVATVLLTFYSIRSVSKSRYAAILGSILYLLLPYRFTNIYARGALGETLAMTFIPLLLAGFYHVLFGEKKKWPLLVIGFSGLLQSHVLSFVMMVILFTACCFIFARNVFSEKRWLKILKAAVYTTLLNLWFVVPFTYFYLKGNLNTGALSWSNYAEYAVNPSSFAYTASLTDYRYLSFGIPVLLCFFVGLLHLIADKKQQITSGQPIALGQQITSGQPIAPGQQIVSKQQDTSAQDYESGQESFLTFLFLAGCVMTFMITGYFASTEFMKLTAFKKLFQLIQFPWRLFGPVSAMVIFSAVIWLAKSNLFGKYKQALFFVLTACCLFTVTTVPENNENFAYYSYDDTYTTGHEIKLRGIQASDATIRYPYEWRTGGLMDDELLKDVYPSDYENTEVISYTKKGTDATLVYQTATQGSYVELPIMYYKGYHAVDENGKELAITMGNGSSLKIDLQGDGQEHQIIVDYRMPTAFWAALLVSVLTLLVVPVYKIVTVLRARKRKTV